MSLGARWSRASNRLDWYRPREIWRHLAYPATRQCQRWLGARTERVSSSCPMLGDIFFHAMDFSDRFADPIVRTASTQVSAHPLAEFIACESYDGRAKIFRN